MARNISQIYAEAIYTRNNYLQLTELNSGRTRSKMSILNLMTYVAAVIIHTYEVALDLFQADIATIISSRINGTAPYYVAIAKLFQFNPLTQANDKMSFNENTYKVGYDEVDESHRIIVQAGYEEYEEDGIILKVCKTNTDSTEIANGTLYTPLSDVELTAFKQYISNVKFCGARIYCVSTPADIVYIHTSNSAPIYYDDTLITKAQALQNVNAAITEYVQGLEFDSYIRYQKIIDVIQKAEGISDISSNVTIGIRQYNNKKGTYDSEIKITGRIRSGAGYIKFVDENGKSTIEDAVFVSETQRDNVKSSGLLDTKVNTTTEHNWSKVDDTWISPEIRIGSDMVAAENTYTQRIVRESAQLNLAEKAI